jgi:hypothetical protein
MNMLFFGLNIFYSVKSGKGMTNNIHTPFCASKILNESQRQVQGLTKAYSIKIKKGLPGSLAQGTLSDETV